MAYRRGRINEEMTKEITEILRTVKDPRVSGAFITVTATDCTADLKFAKIYYSAIGDKEDVSDGLKSASGYIRSQLAQRMNLRQTPLLNFILDRSIEHGAHIAQILNKISEKDSDEAESDDDE